MLSLSSQPLSLSEPAGKHKHGTKPGQAAREQVFPIYSPCALPQDRPGPEASQQQLGGSGQAGPSWAALGAAVSQVP